MTIATALRRKAPEPLRAVVRHLRAGGLTSIYGRLTFSQEGEDGLLRRMFEGHPPGFFVDVGAHHPTRFSNTYSLYLRGWHGINIDATPGSMRSFQSLRPRDINLEVAIGAASGDRDLYVFDDQALNSLSEALSTHRGESTDYNIERTVAVPVRTLGSVIEDHLPAGTLIDLLTVDVEGLDLEVLQSNDWRRFRPQVVMVELLASCMADLGDRPETALLNSEGYQPFAKLLNTVVFTQGGGWPPTR